MHDRVASVALPEPAEKWQPLASFLAAHVEPHDLLLAPYELIHNFRGTVALHVRKRMMGGASISFYAFESEKLDQIDPAHFADAAALAPVYADRWFAVFARAGARLPADQEPFLAPVLDRMRAATAAPESAPGSGAVAVVATFDRSWALARTLKSLAAAFPRILVVDDGSGRFDAWRNRRAARAVGAEYLAMPRNIGLANAVNAGVAFWLAHADAAWISVFNDDVEVAPHLAGTLAAVAQAAPYPRDALLLTGYLSPFHPVQASATIAGQVVALCNSCSGQHMHAHRDHWSSLLPVPTAYLGAPKRSGGVFGGHGSDTDWWVGSWSPRSGVKRGSPVLAIPGLVTTFGKGRSTWGAPGV